jgi:hypothetical protein
VVWDGEGEEGTKLGGLRRGRGREGRREGEKGGEGRRKEMPWSPPQTKKILDPPLIKLFELSYVYRCSL